MFTIQFFSKHDTGIHHPENDNRASYIFNQIKDEKFFNSIVKIPTQPCDPRFLEFAHHPAYLKLAKLEIENGLNKLSTGDTAICKDSWTVASLASGGILNAIKQVSEHKIKNAFCITRPLVIMLMRKREWDFVSLTMLRLEHVMPKRYLVTKKFSLLIGMFIMEMEHRTSFIRTTPLFSSVLIKAHGIQAQVEAKKRVQEKVLVLPKISHSRQAQGQKKYLNLRFSSKLPKFVSKFKPDLIIISAGFDSRKDDPLGQFKLNDEDFYNLTKVMIDLADEHCEGKLISVLEGGYNLKGLANASISHLKALLGKDF